MVLASGVPVCPQTPVAGSVTEESRDRDFGILIDGSATFKEQDWTNYTPAVFGAILYSGDLLRVEEGAHAKIVCSDLTVHEVQAGINGVPCSTAQGVLWRVDGSLINPTRSRAYDGSYPLVLSPRRTQLLSPTPRLRWTPVKGVEKYLVKIRSPKGIWSGQSARTEIEYPAWAPPLEFGTDYKLIAEANGESSNSEPGPGLGFSLLAKDEAEVVRKQEGQLNRLGFAPGPTAFLTAHIYAAHDLNAEAIDQLEGLAKTFTVAAVQRLLGDLYMRVGLPRQAESCYINFLELASSENDQVGQMKAHLTLAKIYQQVFGNSKSASEQLSSTLALAIKIGDDRTTRQAYLLRAEIKNGRW